MPYDREARGQQTLRLDRRLVQQFDRRIDDLRWAANIVNRWCTDEPNRDRIVVSSAEARLVLVALDSAADILADERDRLVMSIKS